MVQQGLTKKFPRGRNAFTGSTSPALAGPRPKSARTPRIEVATPSRTSASPRLHHCPTRCSRASRGNEVVAKGGLDRTVPLAFGVEGWLEMIDGIIDWFGHHRLHPCPGPRVPLKLVSTICVLRPRGGGDSPDGVEAEGGERRCGSRASRSQRLHYVPMAGHHPPRPKPSGPYGTHDAPSVGEQGHRGRLG